MPEQIADFLALAGDSVDNIPGVPGVGKKTASALLSHFGSRWTTFTRTSIACTRSRCVVRKRLGAKLDTHRDAAVLARKLTGIATDAPIGDADEGLAPGRPDLGDIRRAVRRGRHRYGLEAPGRADRRHLLAVAGDRPVSRHTPRSRKTETLLTHSTCSKPKRQDSLSCAQRRRGPRVPDVYDVGSPRQRSVHRDGTPESLGRAGACRRNAVR